MIADIGTKLLPRQQFEFLRDMMNGYAIVAASKNHRKPLPAMAITHKQIVSVSVEGEAGSAGSEWRNRVRGPNTRKKGKPQRSSGNQWPMNSDDPNAMVTEKRPSMPGLDRRWCFFYGTKRDRDAWMVDRGNEIKRLKRIEHFKQATHTDGDWREGWLQNYHKRMQTRIALKRAQDALGDVSLEYPEDNAMQHEADVFGYELDGRGYPTNYAQAIQDADQHDWNQAVDNEIAALEGAGFEVDGIGNVVD